MTNGKGSGRRPRKITKAAYDTNYDRIYGEGYQECKQAQIDSYIEEARKGGSTDEEIEAVLDDRWGITETLEEYEKC